MNVKKFALIGVIALVVVGCVAVAGCTSNQTLQAGVDEKIVGTWAGTDNFGGEKTTTVINSDGTGIYVSVGTAHIPHCYSLDWKKNINGTYAVNFSNGDVRLYSVDSTGTILTSNSGNNKYKHFMDNLVPGGWYSKEKNILFMFNADGTGFWNEGKGISQCTWHKASDGKYVTHYYSGNNPGKTYEWIYDKANNVLIDADGDKFVRPTESVKERVLVIT